MKLRHILLLVLGTLLLTSVTNVIESSVNSVPGIEHIQSTSSPGVSVVNITFGLEKNVDVAFSEVQSKVNQAQRRLPRGTDPPIVAKVETNASPIFWMALQGDRTQQQLNQYALKVVKKKLEIDRQRIAAEKYQVEKERLERIADEQHAKEWFKSTHKTRQKMIDRLEEVEAPEERPELRISMESTERSGKNVITRASA